MLYNVGIYDWENILTKRYSALDIFRFYIGYKVEINKPFNSPLRVDNNPSFELFVTKEKDIMYKDFGNGDAGDWIKFVQTMYGLTRREAVIKTFIDLMLYDNKVPDSPILIEYEKRNCSTIGIKLASLRQSDIDYWKQFNISTILLNMYNVVPISTVWIDNIQAANRNGQDLMYAYLINRKIKIYRPLQPKKKRWTGNADSSCIFGYEQLPEYGDLVIITKALKDIMTLRSFGYFAIAANSETSVLKESIIKDLQDRFKKIVVLLDNDEAGINTARKYHDKYNLKYVIIPIKYECKDISDFVKKYSIEKTEELLTKLI